MKNGVCSWRAEELGGSGVGVPGFCYSVVHVTASDPRTETTSQK